MNTLFFDIDEMYESEFKAFDFSSATIESTRNTILTFCNLLPRLPTETKQNKLASTNIFLDWKAFVDGQIEFLKGKKLIFVDDNESIGIGTDNLEHPYHEIYLDAKKTIKFIDYSSTIINDRWDYWSEADFS